MLSQDEKREIQEKLRMTLVEGGHLIKGSLVVNRRRCGKPTCRCAQGQLHESVALTYKQRARSVLLHVPADLQAEATRAIREHQRVKRLLSRLSEINLAALRQNIRSARAAKANHRPARHATPQSKAGS
jgi:hypothetical protein